MDLKRCFAPVVSALVLLAVSLPLHAQQQSPFNPSLAGLNAANGLLALPWPGLVDTELKPLQAHLTAISGQNFMDLSGPGYQVTMGFDSLTLGTNADTLAPGFVSSPGGFAVRAPLNGSWYFSISGNLDARLAASADLTLTKGISTGTVHLVDQTVSVPFSMGINDISLTASSTLDPSDPARPKLLGVDVQAFVNIGGSVLFPGVGVPVNFVRQPDGSLIGQIALTEPLLLGIPNVNVSDGLQISIILLPFSTQNTWAMTVTVSGVVSVDFPQPVGHVTLPSTPFFILPIVLPGNEVFGDSVVASLAMARGPIPIPWPPANSLAPPASAAQVAPTLPVDFSAPLATIEPGIVATHMPYNAVLSLDYPASNLLQTAGAILGPKGPPYTLGIDADSTIWTGHYLAAESFRYAVTKNANALARVQAAIAGLASDFSVTTDAVLENNQYTAVSSATNSPTILKLPTAPNLPIVTNLTIPTNVPQSQLDEAGFIFARSTIPYTSEAGSTLPDWTASVQSRIKTGVCLYVKPSGGWDVGPEPKGKQTVPTKNYPTYAAALKAQASSGGVIRPVDSIAKPISYGTACGNRGDADNVLSRDQYSGVLMGLTYAYVLVPQVQPQVRTLLDGAIDYVILNHWNVPLPPDRTIITSFMGGFDAQLLLLRIGATVDPTHVPAGTNQSYQQLYTLYSPASALCWLPDWFSTADPLNGYYKYNLSHSYLGTLLFLESDPTLQSNYLTAYNIMRAATGNHRNAYFNLVDILVKAATISSPSLSNPSLTLKQETTSDLVDWVTRWNLVKGTSGMPMDSTPQAGAVYLTSLWPDYIKIYANISNSQNWTTTFPIPLQDRTGNGMEFVWQMPPSTGGIDSPGSSRTVTVPPPPIVKGHTYLCSATPPTADQIAACSTQSTQEEPGVDFLLAYWLGAYLNVWSAQ